MREYDLFIASNESVEVGRVQFYVDHTGRRRRVVICRIYGSREEFDAARTAGRSFGFFSGTMGEASEPLTALDAAGPSPDADLLHFYGADYL